MGRRGGMKNAGPYRIAKKEKSRVKFAVDERR